MERKFLLAIAWRRAKSFEQSAAVILGTDHAAGHATKMSLADFLIELGEIARIRVATMTDLGFDNRRLAGFDPVTVLDRAIEVAMRQNL